MSEAEDLIWRSRILEERVLELEEYQMTTNVQLDSQIERVEATLFRQRITNENLKEHCKKLDKEIELLKKIYNELASS